MYLLKSFSLKLSSAFFALCLALPGHGAPADARTSAPKAAAKTVSKALPKTAAKTIPQAVPRTPGKPSSVRKVTSARPVAARVAIAASAAGVAGAAAALADKKPVHANANARSEDAEARLLAVYRLIGQARNRQALALAE